MTRRRSKMKRAVAWFSLTVITVFAVYVSFKMSYNLMASPTYEGIASLIVQDTMEKTKALNVVTAIVFDFRGYDTLGEAFVLFTAVSGAATILRKNKKLKGGN
jgi:multisubunit Na+/H+ antiporter MnhB subunit